jgi:putative flippase GtrA
VLKKQIVNFILVGVINTVVGYGLYALLLFVGFHYILAVFFATVLGVLFNFKTIGKYVFNSIDNKLIIKFFGVYSLVFIVNIVLIKIFKDFGFDEYLAGLIATFPSAIISFVFNKYYVFKGGLEK